MLSPESKLKPEVKRPNLVVVMGVSGCGKSTIAQKIANTLSYRCLEADDYHSEEAKSRMASGIPLTNEMRKPWVRSICGHLRQLARLHIDCTLAFSGLRREHRDQIREAGYNTIFVFLNGDKNTIRRRMDTRANHFMPTKLLDSQFDTLERPVNEDDVIVVPIDAPVGDVVTSSLKSISKKLITA